MNSYRVFDQCRLGKEIALCDSQGRFHIASIACDVPVVGTDLNGVPPKLGLRTLLASARGQMYRVTFEAVDCSLESAFQRLHPQLTARPESRNVCQVLRG